MLVRSRTLQVQEEVVLCLPHRFTAARRIGIAQNQLGAKVAEDQVSCIVVVEHERDTGADQVRKAKFRRCVIDAVVKGMKEIVLVGPHVGNDRVLWALRFGLTCPLPWFTRHVSNPALPLAI